MAAQPIFDWSDTPDQRPGIPLASGVRLFPEFGPEAIGTLEKFRVDTKLALARRMISEEFPCTHVELVDSEFDDERMVKVFEIHAEISKESLEAVTRISLRWEEIYPDSEFEFVLWA